MKIIGIAGVAGAGKDLFFDLLSEELECKKFSLAEELKEEVKNHCIKYYNTDPTKCTRNEKNLIRPLLVGHGTIKREQTSGRYWIEKLEPKIKDFIFNNYIKNSNKNSTLPCITDIRYDEYEKDEIHWLKKEMNGVLVHVSKFKRGPKGKLHFLNPANEQEAINNPKAYKAADYLLQWEHIEDSPSEIKRRLKQSGIKDFIKWFKKIT